MPNKAILNLKSFSFGKSASMASLLVPTTELHQDVRQYEPKTEFTTVGDVKSAFSGNHQTGTAKRALSLFVEKLSPELYSEITKSRQNPETEEPHPVDAYLSAYKTFRYSQWVYDCLQDCNAKIDELADLVDDGISVRNAINFILVSFSEGFLFEVSGQDAIQFVENIESAFHELDSDEELTDNDIFQISSMCRKFIFAFENGGNYYNDLEFDKKASLSKLKKEMYDRRKQLPLFYNMIQYLLEMDELSTMIPGADDFQTKMKLSDMLDDKKDKMAESFENIRLVYNKSLMDKYVDNAVGFPYFLDLGFDNVTQLDLSKDTDGTQMHSLEREFPDNGGWGDNFTVGDRLRIRDMFRIDKLNKKSAFESAALYPGISGLELDEKMEGEDVITRLAQDDWDFEGIVGTTSTPDGVYVLTDASDTISGIVMGTNFSEEELVQETGTIRTFRRIPDVADYLKTRIVDSSVSFQRIFGFPDENHSSSKDFDNWYMKYGNSITIHKPASYSEVSRLKILGESSYDFTPSEDGIFQVLSIYSSTDNEHDVSAKSPANGVSFAGSIGDFNYKPNTLRKIEIEIPCNENSQYSYLSFEFGINIDPKMKSGIASGEYFIDFSLDDGVPIRLYFISGTIDNLTENNPMYLSMKNVKVPTIGSKEKVLLKIENDLVNMLPRKFTIGIASTIPELTAISSEDTIDAYKKTYVFISNIQIYITNSTSYGTTYGNYLEYKNNAGEDISDFWNLSRSVHSSPYQHLLEIPSVISLNNTKKLCANYKTADLFSDTITLKNQMDSEYRMKLDDAQENFILDRFRKYSGIDSCSGVISLYYDSDLTVKAEMKRNHGPQEKIGQGFEATEINNSSHPHSTQLRYKRIETIRSINRLVQSIRHKSNLFSVIIENSGIKESLEEAQFKVKSAENDEDKRIAEENLEKIKKDTEKMRNVITMMTKNICEEYAPAHNQLFKVYFE